MAEWGGMVVAVLVALAGGAGGAELIRAVREWRAGVAGRHQRELLRLGDQLANTEKHRNDLQRERDAAIKAVRVAERRERLATEWGHRNAIIAIRAGVPEEQMPVLNFRDDE